MLGKIVMYDDNPVKLIKSELFPETSYDFVDVIFGTNYGPFSEDAINKHFKVVADNLEEYIADSMCISIERARGIIERNLR